MHVPQAPLQAQLGAQDPKGRRNTQASHPRPRGRSTWLSLGCGVGGGRPSWTPCWRQVRPGRRGRNRGRGSLRRRGRPPRPSPRAGDPASARLPPGAREPEAAGPARLARASGSPPRPAGPSSPPSPGASRASGRTFPRVPEPGPEAPGAEAAPDPASDLGVAAPAPLGAAGTWDLCAATAPWARAAGDGRGSAEVPAPTGGRGWEGLGGAAPGQGPVSPEPPLGQPGLSKLSCRRPGPRPPLRIPRAPPAERPRRGRPGTGEVRGKQGAEEVSSRSII